MTIAIRNNNRAPLVVPPAVRRAIDARLAKADEDIREGRVYGPFESAHEMAASIEANIKKLRAAKRKAKSPR